MILTIVLMVAFGWGVWYLVITGIRALGPETIIVETALRKKSSPQSLTIMIGGDIMMDRNIRALGEKNGYETLFDEPLAELFKKADIAMANLEGPITSYPSKNLINGKAIEVLTFTFSPASRSALTTAGFDIVSLANNHTDNFGLIGFKETQDWLSDAKIAWFGNPWNATSTSLMRSNTSNEKTPISTIVTKNGITVAFVGYHAFQKGLDNVVSEIRRVSGPDVFTIVMPHWGEEYATTSSAKMKSQARSFISAGADAVIGAHPHVIMDEEWIDGVPVIYSLGNLLFDQYFSPQVMKGMVVQLNLVKDTSGVHLEKLSSYNNLLVRGRGSVLETDRSDVR